MAEPSVAEKSGRSLKELAADINAHLEGTGFKFVGFGPDSVGVQGDSRVVGPSAVIADDGKALSIYAGKVSTDLVNKVKGLTRVLLDIPTA